MFDSTWQLPDLWTALSLAALCSLALLAWIACGIMIQLRRKEALSEPLYPYLPTAADQKQAKIATAGLYRVRMPQERPPEPEVIVIGGRPERLKEP